MPASRSLPARPSLDSLRKQAKKLARDRSVSLRDAQVLLAREYGYRGWQDLTAEVHRRLGKGLEWAVTAARRVIHDNDIERLKQLLADYPALLSWQGDDGEGGVLGMATGAYGDCFEPFSEQHFTRRACAEVLIDAGAVVMPEVCDGLLKSRARGLLQLFQQRGLLPRALKFRAALGDIDAVHPGDDQATIGEGFTIACDFKHQAVASALLDRSIAVDPELGRRIDGGVGRAAFIDYFIENRPAAQVTAVGVWKAFVMEQVSRAVYSWSGHETSLASPSGHSDPATFIALLRREPWLLEDAFVPFQADLIGRAALHGRGELITALLDLDPAILRRQPPPPSQAVEFAFTYAKTHVLPMLTRIWPLPDDLPHAAGMGNLPQVKKWFDESGAAALGNIEHHYPSSPYMPRARVDEYVREWGPIRVQRVLDTALAWSVINGHLDVAQFLLDHGADINTTWSSHEPASLLHELVFHANYESMQFLIDRGIDMTIRDYRWNATAQGWARHAAKDEEMAQWLEDAERRREQTR
jgi:Ankyrin repeats (3 copies)